MRARLDESKKLVPPGSVDEGQRRLQQLDHEIDKIDRAIAAGNRAGAGVRGWLDEERRQLKIWLRDAVEAEVDEIEAFWRSE